MSSTERVIGLCATPPEQRSEEEVEFVAKWVGANSSYFRNIRKEAICEVVRDSRLQRFRRNELIIRQGEKGHSFYVIVTGRVSVYVNSDLEQACDDGQEVKTDVAVAGKSTPANAANRETADDDENDSVGEDAVPAEDELQVDGEEPMEGGEELRSRLLGTRVLQMGEGYAFGEIALTSVNSIRKASVICDEDTSVLAIHQDSYAKSLRTYQEQEYQLIDGFIDSCSLFANWRNKQRLSLRNSLRREVYGYGEAIVRQGQQSGGLFFIVKGSVKLLADPNKWPALVKSEEEGKSEKQSPALHPQLGTAARAAAVAAAAATAGAPDASPPALRRHRQGYQAAEIRQRSRQIEVALLGEGEVLGQVELLAGFGQSLTSTIVTEPTSGYWLNRANCRRLLSRNKATIAQLRQTILLRLQSRSRRAPIMRHLGRDPRVAGVAAAAAAAAASAAAVPLDPAAAGQQQRQLQQHQQADLLHTRKQPPSADKLWQHMLAMYVEGRSQLIVPADPSLYYRHLCRVNAERRQHLRIRAMPPKLREELEEQAADAETSVVMPHRYQLQSRRPAAPRSLRLLRRELETAGGSSTADLDHRKSDQDSNRQAFRPAEAKKRMDGAAADNFLAADRSDVNTASAPRLWTDFELSKTHLRSLERRIEAFCGDSPSVGAHGHGHWKGRKPHIEPLLCLPDSDAQKHRIRGSRVLVRTKQCSVATNEPDGPTVIGHRHVTNHLVQSLPDWNQLVLQARRERLQQLEKQTATAPGLVSTA